MQQNAFEISVPSKTFLIGEYIAIYGGPCLIINSEKRFVLRVTPKSSQHENSNIDPNGPAGKYLHKYREIFANYYLDFIDPYQGLGGLGASSAAYLAVKLAKQKLSDECLQYNSNEWQKIVDEYRRYAWDGHGLPPSGLDVVSQYVGDICYLNLIKNDVNVVSWSFSSLGFCVVRTGNKVATHLHLAEMPTFDTELLIEVSLQATHALQDINDADFITTIKTYKESLVDANLCCENTINLCDHLDKYPAVLATKGCGALGADTILIIYDKQQQNELYQSLDENKFQRICDQNSISSGAIIKDLT